MNRLVNILTNANGKLNAYRFFVFVTVPFFILLAVIAFRNHFHGYIDRDTASYIAIAFKYQRGDFFGAINGYWSPMYSWLLTPLLFTGIDPDLLLALINVLSSFIILYQLYKILQAVKLVYYLNCVTQLSFALALAQFSFVNITPDLLNLVFIIIYLRLYITKQIFEKPFLTALLGALMYLSKYYTLGFFAAHICLVYFTERFLLKRKTGNAFIKTITVFGLISSLWILCLSVKYKEFMPAYTGSYNHAITASGKVFHSWELNGLVPPAPNQLFPWEDIKQVYHFKDWSPFDSREAFHTQVTVFKSNFNYFIEFLSAGTRYGLYINLLIVLVLIIQKRSFVQLSDDINIKLLVTGLIFVSGYLLILLCNDRYIWLLYFLSVLSIVIFLNNFLKNQPNWWWHALTIIFLIYCFNKKQFDLIRRTPGKDWDSLPENISLFKKIIKPGDRVITTETVTAGHFPIDTRCLYYGTTLGYKTDTLRMLADIKKYDINFIITTDTASHPPPAFIYSFQKIAEPFKEIKIYKVEPNVTDSLYAAFSQER